MTYTQMATDGLAGKVQVLHAWGFVSVSAHASTFTLFFYWDYANSTTINGTFNSPYPEGPWRSG